MTDSTRAMWVHLASFLAVLSSLLFVSPLGASILATVIPLVLYLMWRKDAGEVFANHAHAVLNIQLTSWLVSFAVILLAIFTPFSAFLAGEAVGPVMAILFGAALVTVTAYGLITFFGPIIGAIKAAKGNETFTYWLALPIMPLAQRLAARLSKKGKSESANSSSTE